MATNGQSSAYLGGLFLVLGGFFQLFDNHPLENALAGLYDLEATAS